MRNFLLAAAAVPLAVMTAPVAPASAGGCCDDHHHGYRHHGYAYSYTYRYEAPPPVVYKHYLPDEDDFTPKYKHHSYVPWYARQYYYRPIYSYRSSYRHSRYSDDRHDSDDDCRWLKRRAKHTDSRYWWKRYHDCKD